MVFVAEQRGSVQREPNAGPFASHPLSAELLQEAGKPVPTGMIAVSRYRGLNARGKISYGVEEDGWNARDSDTSTAVVRFALGQSLHAKAPRLGCLQTSSSKLAEDRQPQPCLIVASVLSYRLLEYTVENV
jgi:hypothetical protein